MESHDFLENLTLRPIELPDSPNVLSLGLALGQGPHALEVVVATSSKLIPTSELRSVWKARKGGRATPVLLVVLYAEKASVCGPAGEEAPVYQDLDRDQVERVCQEALEQPDRHAALRALRDSLPSLESELAGIRNEGFLATHELKTGARERPDWEDARNRASTILSLRGQDLLNGLGFEVDHFDRVTSILRSHEQKVAIAVLLQRDESPELQSDRFSSQSPVSYALAVADRENVSYVVVQYGTKIRVHPTDVGVGVGRRGRTETYVECHTGLLRDEDAAYLWLLCSAEALRKGGSLEQLLEESTRFAGDLAEKLRDRIYHTVVPRLAEGVVAARRLVEPTVEELATTYQMTMTLLFRLLFLAYAEDKDLLPYRLNDLYRRRSLKTKAHELQDLIEHDTEWSEGADVWQEVRQLFHAVDRGNVTWGVPAYDGGLFSSQENISAIGGKIDALEIADIHFGPALTALLLMETGEGLGPVDFRSLGVREFGTIYEGLLESELSVADTDLTVDKEGFYRPFGESEVPEVRDGEVYLHNASGARKATGSYFTKHFAVEHLLEKALEPALLEHLARLDDLDDEQAGEFFFDFRVADIAMGSGHFLVAAIDRIERALSGYLNRRPLPTVTAELLTLSAAAASAMGEQSGQIEIEDTQLLRRFIARRCIYGVDINPVAVDLARLAIWIHTFVSGLPLSFLDHNLVQGNSLVGVGQTAEILDRLKEEKLYGWLGEPEEYLQKAAEPLRRLARLADANPSELDKARAAWEEASTHVRPLKALCHVLTVSRIEGTVLFERPKVTWKDNRELLLDTEEYRHACDALYDLYPLHFPTVFPEVFLRERAGFDVILGNPPWEEATVEEDAFWARHYPGLRSLPQREQEARKAELREERPDLASALEAEQQQADKLRRALTAGGFPGMGTGDPDLYKAFVWRFWGLLTDEGGRMGVVLPRSAMAAKGSADFRRHLFESAECLEITMLLNKGQWIFEQVHPQYTIGLISALKRDHAGDSKLYLDGPYHSYDAYTTGVVKETSSFYGSEVVEWNDTASIPLLPSPESIEVFAVLRMAPRLDLDDGESWRARPHTELHATNDKQHFDLESTECPEGFWPVYKGESFDIWEPDRGKYYAWADPEVVIPVLQRKRERAPKRSAFSEFPLDWRRDLTSLPCHSPRIAFRDISRATDSRTVRTALIPPNVFITNKGPYFLWPRGTAQDQAYFLGVLSSIPLDWYARRFVETTLNFFILNPFPVPRPEPDNAFRHRVVELAGRLAAVDERYSEWASSVGVEFGPLADDEKSDMIHELDAVVAHLYNLKEHHVVHIYKTFHEGWDYQDRLDAILTHYNTWKSH